MKSHSPKVTDNDAYALLSLRSAPNSPSRLQMSGECFNEADNAVLARFEGKDFEYIMRTPQKRVTVGRSSSKGQVDINMEPSSFVSRCHFTVYYEESVGNRFFVVCSGKNGIFVDGTFQRKGAEPLELPTSCTFRFPSTSIKIHFQSITSFSNLHVNTVNSIKPEIKHDILQPPIYSPASRRFSQPLHISLPSHLSTSLSPCPSPTGTLSAANSCPTSPRSGSASKYFLEVSQIPSGINSNDNGDISHDNSDLNDSISVFEAYESEDGDNKDTAKPPYSYAQLIVQAIASNVDRQMTLSGIYAYISKQYPYYKPADKGWQNSIRHNLSLNRFFVKVPRTQEYPGKGSFWRIEPSSEAKLIEQAFRRRRQRIVNCFRMNSNDNTNRSLTLSPEESNNQSSNNLVMLSSNDKSIFIKTAESLKSKSAGCIQLTSEQLSMFKQQQQDQQLSLLQAQNFLPTNHISTLTQQQSLMLMPMRTQQLTSAKQLFKTQHLINPINTNTSNNVATIRLPPVATLTASAQQRAAQQLSDYNLIEGQTILEKPRLFIMPSSLSSGLDNSRSISKLSDPIVSSLPISLLQPSTPQQQQLQNTSQQQQMQALIIQKLIQQGAMVLSHIPSSSSDEIHKQIHSPTSLYPFSSNMQILLTQNQQQKNTPQQQLVLLPPQLTMIKENTSPSEVKTEKDNGWMDLPGPVATINSQINDDIPSDYPQLVSMKSEDLLLNNTLKIEKRTLDDNLNSDEPILKHSKLNCCSES